MAVYLYNLLFSLTGTDYTLGRFTQFDGTIVSPTILNQSCAWFTYLATGTPFGYGNYFRTVPNALTPSHWGSCQSDSGSLQMNPGDYLMMRVASLDASAAGYLTQFTAVFGRGTSQLLTPGPSDLQSPLVMNTPNAQSPYPRAVIDGDGTQGSNWPGPIPSDNSWVNWLGAVQAAPGGVANDYTINAGISVYTSSNYYTFGRDPRLHVGGMVKRKHDDCAA
jgi:hypothetical protein